MKTIYACNCLLVVFTGAPFQNSTSGRPSWLSGEQSTSRPYPGHRSFPPLSGLDEPTSIQRQTEYLRSLRETATDENFPAFDTRSQQTTQIGLSWDSIIGLDSSSSTSLNSSSGYFESSTEMLPSSSVFSFGQGSGLSSGQSETPGSPSHRSQQPSIAGTRMTTTEGHVCDQEVSDLIGVTPFNAGTEIDIQRYLMQDAKVEVDFYDLENRVFEKQQSRKDKQARQRIINGKVKFMVFSDRHVKDVRVWVGRETKAAKLEKDDNGMVPIQAILLRKDNRNVRQNKT